MVGDFAGFVSPVTGEDLYYAIKGGQLAAEAIHQNMQNKTPLTTYQQNWQQEFGVNLNKYGYILRERVYKSKRRMELVVTLGKHDRKMGDTPSSGKFRLPLWAKHGKEIFHRLLITFQNSFTSSAYFFLK